MQLLRSHEGLLSHGNVLRGIGALGLAGVFVLASVSRANADAPPKAEILVIHATKCDKKTVDPAIGEPPPSAMGFDCLKLVEKKVVPLPVGQANTTVLPNGRTFQLVHTERVGNRYKVTASINSADGKGFTKLADITADPNKQFNVGGWMYQGGAIVLTIKILP